MPRILFVHAGKIFHNKKLARFRNGISPKTRTRVFALQARSFTSISNWRLEIASSSTPNSRRRLQGQFRLQQQDRDRWKVVLDLKHRASLGLPRRYTAPDGARALPVSDGR
jgi:hypothetical protein